LPDFGCGARAGGVRFVSEAELLLAARRAAEAAYAPYSGFRVGAALLCEDGSVVIGCNVENASYGLSICAERAAVFAAVAGGARRFRTLALCCPDRTAVQLVVPCGACRQVLAEFAGPELAVIAEGGERTTLAALLPSPFTLG
jgi:cytidine deaminase